MKVKVQKVFRDKHSQEVYSIGNEIEVTEERFDEIVTNLDESFVEVIEADDKEVEFPKFIENGVYELSNGDQIKTNKKEAVKAEAALTEK